MFDPWHYVPVLARKPGALRNGAPFKDWVLPAAHERIRRKLAGSADGDRQMVEILTAVLGDGLSAVEAAQRRGTARGRALGRRGAQHPGPPAGAARARLAADAREPAAAPRAGADCARYDSLRRAP